MSDNDAEASKYTLGTLGVPCSPEWYDNLLSTLPPSYEFSLTFFSHHKKCKTPLKIKGYSSKIKENRGIRFS